MHLVGASIEESIAAAIGFAGRTGAVLVHPFDHADIIAGQGTVGLEILEQVPDVATVLVPTVGGGLLGGVAAAIKAGRPDVLDVAHSRISGALPLGEVDVSVTCETRGAEHCAELMDGLCAAGHTIIDVAGAR